MHHWSRNQWPGLAGGRAETEGVPLPNAGPLLSSPLTKTTRFEPDVMPVAVKYSPNARVEMYWIRSRRYKLTVNINIHSVNQYK